MITLSTGDQSAIRAVCERWDVPPHVMDALDVELFATVASIAQGWMAVALEAAADELDETDEVMIGETDIGSNMIPVPAPERLRMMADRMRIRAVS